MSHTIRMRSPNRCGPTLQVRATKRESTNDRSVFLSLQAEKMISHHAVDSGMPVEVEVADLPLGIYIDGAETVTVHPLDGRPVAGGILVRDEDGGWERTEIGRGGRDGSKAWSEYWPGKPRTDALLIGGSRWAYGGWRGEGSSTVYHDCRHLSRDVVDVLRARPGYFKSTMILEDGVLYLADEGAIDLFVERVAYSVAQKVKFLGRRLWLGFDFRRMMWRFEVFLCGSLESRSSGYMALGSRKYRQDVDIRKAMHATGAGMSTHAVDESREIIVAMEDSINDLGIVRDRVSLGASRSTTMLGELCERIDPHRRMIGDLDFCGEPVSRISVRGHRKGASIDASTPRHWASWNAQGDEAWIASEYTRVTTDGVTP